MAHVLIIDDDRMICETLSRRVIAMGHTVEKAFDLHDGLAVAASEPFDVVFLDVNLPDGNGLIHLPLIRETASKPEVIIITAEGNPDGAELAVKTGAWDYIQKPFSKEEIMLQLERALQYRQGELKRVHVALKRDAIIGSSPRINLCLNLVAQAVQTNVNVLLTGETGTGKEVFARAIHANSPRAGRDFVVVDCTVLPGQLVESILFGHQKGAFTGADSANEGLIKLADGGSLFLDEVGDLPLSSQKAFLRVLQEHRFRPVGSGREETSDFRLIAATNRDLDDMVRSGRFREDLLFRLRAFTIEIPPLRDRTADIKEIAMYHVAKLCERNGIETKGFSPEFFHTLASYNWPGNVRELVNTLESAISLEPLNPILYPKHLPDNIRTKIIHAAIKREISPTEASGMEAGHPKGLPTLNDLRERSIAALEKQYLQNLMTQTNGEIKEACRISGLGRARLYELMKKYNISKTPRPD